MDTQTLGQNRIDQIIGNKPRKLPRHGEGEEFIKGPIPMQWISAAAKLPGKALAIALVIWFKAGVTKRVSVILSHTLLQKFGVSRKAGYGGLKNLEAAGLVEVKRHAGCCPEVTILALDKSENNCKNIT